MIAGRHISQSKFYIINFFGFDAAHRSSSSLGFGCAREAETLIPRLKVVDKISSRSFRSCSVSFLEISRSFGMSMSMRSPPRPLNQVPRQPGRGTGFSPSGIGLGIGAANSLCHGQSIKTLGNLSKQIPLFHRSSLKTSGCLSRTLNRLMMAAIGLAWPRS